MTLTEYINQKNPVRSPRVTLEPSEYEITHTIKVGQDILRFIYIPAIWLRYKASGYVQKNNQEQLYTMDQDGNPKYLAVFKIAHLKQ